MFISVPDRIRIRPKVSDPYGSGSGSATLILKELKYVVVVALQIILKKNNVIFSEIVTTVMCSEGFVK